MDGTQIDMVLVSARAMSVGEIMAHYMAGPRPPAICFRSRIALWLWRLLVRVFYRNTERVFHVSPEGNATSNATEAPVRACVTCDRLYTCEDAGEYPSTYDACEHYFHPDATDVEPRE